MRLLFWESLWDWAWSNQEKHTLEIIHQTQEFWQMKVTILALSVLSLVACYQMVPVPPTYDGLTIGQKGAPV